MKVNLSNFDLPASTRASYVFSGCDNLREICLSSSFISKNRPAKVVMPPFEVWYKDGKGTGYSLNELNSLSGSVLAGWWIAKAPENPVNPNEPQEPENPETPDEPVPDDSDDNENNTGSDSEVPEDSDDNEGDTGSDSENPDNPGQPEVSEWGWIQLADSRWTFKDSKGNLLTGIQSIDGKLYKFNQQGIMLTGWQMTPDGWMYFVSNEGSAKTGWLHVQSGWYYLNQNYIMEQGKWVKDRGLWYYLSSGTGKMAESRWILDNGNWYYVDSFGVMKENSWLKDPNDKQWYYLGNNGVMQKNTVVDGWYLDNSGIGSPMI